MQKLQCRPAVYERVSYFHPILFIFFLNFIFYEIGLAECLELHDQLATIGPILQALTAAAPIYNGYLSERVLRIL